MSSDIDEFTISKAHKTVPNMSLYLDFYSQNIICEYFEVN